MSNNPAILRSFFFTCTAACLMFFPRVAFCVQSITETPQAICVEDDEEFSSQLKLSNDVSPISGALMQNRSLPSWHHMITNLPTDWHRVGENIFQIESVPQILGLAAITGALIVSDEQTWPATRDVYRNSENARTASNYFVAIGDGALHFGIAGTFAAYGFLAGDNRALRTASQTVEAILSTGFVVQGLKHVTGRESPIASTRHRGRWKFFPNPSRYHENEPAYYAFPSGHISTAMATLTVIANNYPEQRWIKPVGYSMVGLLGAGLVAKGMHWYSDLPLGIALGYMFGNVVSTPENADVAKADGTKSIHMVLSPAFNLDGGGIQFAVVF